MTGTLKLLQSAVAQHLRRQLCLPGVSVLARRAGDLDSQVEAAVQSAIGLSVLVLDPRPTRVAPDAPGPAFLEIEITVRVIENILTNDAGVGLLAVAERICQALHLWPLPAECGDGALRLAEQNPWTTPAGTARGAAVVDARFLAAGSLPAETHCV